MYNTSIVGWRGHTENGSTLGTVQGFKHVLKALIHKVLFFLPSKKLISSENHPI